MSSTDSNGWHSEAGEYVLGTLRGTERDLFEKVLERDADAKEHVDYWERQLGALELTRQQQEAKADLPISLPARVWDNIARSLDTVQQSPPTVDSGLQGVSSTGSTAKPPTPSELIPPKIRLRRWRSLAVVSLAASLGLAAFVLQQQFHGTLSQPDPTVAVQPDGYNVVSILGSEDGTDLWAIFAETESGQVRAVALQAPGQSPDGSHQLWVLLPEDAGVQSVGLLPYGTGTVNSYTLSGDIERSRLIDGAAFAVSFEPPGGTTGSVPTGPVISVREYTRLNVDI